MTCATCKLHPTNTCKVGTKMANNSVHPVSANCNGTYSHNTWITENNSKQNQNLYGKV